MEDDPSTLHALQVLLDGLHGLGDAVLCHVYPELRSLRPHGINSEGKPIGGTPDSYVGTSPLACTVAVEYTTTRSEDLRAKFEKDFDRVVRECPDAHDVILCSNRPRDDGIDLALRSRAEQAGRRLRIVWGEDLARTLDDQRQDLREKHLQIPISRLTTYSLVPALQARTVHAIESRLGDLSRELHVRSYRRSLETQFARLRPTRRDGITLVIGAGGQGKTTWSCAAALTLADAAPTVWLPADSLGGDSINDAIINAAYGACDAGRVAELAHVLRSSGRKLLVFIDGIDEVADYRALQRQLQTFRRSSAVAPNTHLILTCRTEALSAFEQAPTNVLPRDVPNNHNYRLTITPLPYDEAASLLQRLGTAPDSVRELMRALPRQFAGNPFYLKLARELQRDGRLPAPGGSWIAAFADHYLNDIAHKLTANGSRPRKAHLRDLLGRIAHLSLQDPQGADPSMLGASPLFMPHLEGEGTFLERAVQSGLLQRNGPRLRFCHALLTEYFCAHHVAASAATAEECVRAIARLPNRAAIAAHAVDMRPELLVAIVAGVPAMLPVFAPDILDASATADLIEKAVVLLRSKYPSEQTAGARIVTTLRTPAAIAAAVDWYNALSLEERAENIDRVASLFLDLQLESAVPVIMAYSELRWLGNGVVWYTQDFARRVEALKPSFREALRKHAWQLLTDDVSDSEGEEHQRRIAVGVLAYLKDERLVAHLDARVQHGGLRAGDHRALIHLNSARSIAVYLSSCAWFRKEINALQQEQDTSRHQRSNLWHQVILKQADIAMFPHDALTEAVRTALISDDREQMWFGMEWAGILGDEELVDPYASADAKLDRVFTFDRMVHRLLAGLDGPGVVAFYERRQSIEAKKMVLSAVGSTPNAEVEEMLLGALENDRLFWDACRGLATLRSWRAGPALHERLAGATGARQGAIVKALGRIRYAPAHDDLLRLWDRVTSARDPADDHDIESNLAEALSGIGGEDVYEKLATRYTQTGSTWILSCLLDGHDGAALAIVQKLVKQLPNAKHDLAPALRHREFLHDDVFEHDTDDATGPEFTDDGILDALLESTTEKLAGMANREKSAFDADVGYREIARFDSPKADAFYGALADRAYSMPDAKRQTSLDEAIHFARKHLAQKGHRGWAREMVEAALDDMIRFTDHNPADVTELERWPEDVVRAVLVARIERADQYLGRWILLLLPFARKEDVEFLREHACKAGDAIADEVRLYLAVGDPEHS